MKDHSLDSTDLTWLAGLARALLGEAHAAEDLVQETAVAAMEGALPVGGARRAWLASVARRLAARRFRGEARRGRREELVARPEALPDSADLVEKAEIAEQVTAAARRLPEPFRRTILLRFLEGLSSEEIAREEGKPADTVRWRVRRGLELLREELVERHDRDWSSWSVLLVPLARVSGDVGVATAGASGVVSGMVASLAVMKTSIALAVVALGCVGLWLAWDSGEEEAGGAFVAAESSGSGDEPAMPAADLDVDPAPVEPGARRAAVTEADPVEDAEVEPEPQELFGRVVDGEGEVVVGATVYLVPWVEGERGESTRGPLLVQTESDGRGDFRFSREDWMSGDAEEEPALDLGVVANGFLRKVIPDVARTQPTEGWVVVLEPGRTLSGRVVDEYGQPVRDLELLAYTATAGVSHVSPSQRLLRAQRNQLVGGSSSYDQCRATTDGRGDVVFTGLPAGDLAVLPLDPGWTIEESRWVEAVDSYVLWTAKSRLGVRLVVVDGRTGQPAERAAATFRFGLTFADGEFQDFGQWVGRGMGEVSFVLGPELLPGLEDRTITRAAFYGTVRSGEGEKVDWVAEAIEDPSGAVGVVEVAVETDSGDASLAEDSDGEEDLGEELETARLVLDVRYEDSTPFEGELTVLWTSDRDPSDQDRDRPRKVGLGRYSLEVTAGELRLEVADRSASGSLPPWRGEVRCDPDREEMAFVTLQRGATATITRPDGWGGEWFVHASWRPRGSEDWQGSLGYSTDESSLTLSVLRSAEWRFELRQDSALDRDPLVRTAFVGAGESVTVDG